MRFIDLRSDTVTEPTDNMRKAMFEAIVGDDVYEDDPTVKELEHYAANLVNKEAALFVPSGTFGNQLALFTHCNRGEEVILGDNCHIVAHEVGASSVIAGVQLRTIDNPKGILDISEVEKRIRKDEDIHVPDTRLICVENAHSTGVVVPLDNMRDIYDLAQKYNLKVHLDGARLFNAAAYLNVSPSEITKYTDSVMFCLSKGLCAPIGSILAGSKEFIHQARKKRKLLGGGLRQSGFLAAAGLVALKEMLTPLKTDHENALLLAEELKKIPGIKVNKEDIHINMVFFNIKDTGIDGQYIVDKLYEKGVKINGEEDGLMRFVTHYWITKEDIYYTCNILKDIVNKNI